MSSIGRTAAQGTRSPKISSHSRAVRAAGADEAAGLDRQRAAQQRQAEILPCSAGALAMKQRRRDAVGEQGRSEVIEHRAEHQLRPLLPAALRHRDAGQALQYLVEAAL